MTGEFPAQRASNAEIVSIWWRHHATTFWVVEKYTERASKSSQSKPWAIWIHTIVSSLGVNELKAIIKTSLYIEYMHISLKITKLESQIHRPSCPQMPALCVHDQLNDLRLFLSGIRGHRFIVCSTVWSGTDQRKQQCSASLAILRGIPWWKMDSPHKGQWNAKWFHLMISSCLRKYWICMHFKFTDTELVATWCPIL